VIRLPRLLLLTVFALAAVQAWLGHAQPPSRLPEPATRSPANHANHADRADHADRFGYRSFTGRFKYQGTASCASMDCHHGTGPAGMKGSEYSLWADRDPHSKAYAVLFEERSKTMLRLYRGLAAKQPSHPEADALCLKCHAISVPPEQRGGRGYEEDRLEPVLADGVGCEGCHGPAERWRTTHYLGWWKQLSHQQKLNDYGLIPTKDLAARVQVCAACHIGAPEMEVNHQLIAAGHPRLNFEYTLAHHNYPRHWRERYGPDFEYRAWVIGQVASARAALVLLRYRAEQAAKSELADWPELAEYNCASCHQGLGGDPKRLRGRTTLKPGTLPWGTWYMPQTVRLTESPPGLHRGAVPVQRDLADRLAELMQRRLPPPEQVAAQAARLIEQLDQWLLLLQTSADADARAGRSLNKATIEQKLRGLVQAAVIRDGGEDYLAFADWEQASQHYLAIAALVRCRVRLDQGQRDRRYAAALGKLTGPLLFPRDKDAAGQTVEYDSPRDFTPERYLGALKHIRALLDIRE
jgi:hypothetical protein